jgi:hypothetical protein
MMIEDDGDLVADQVDLLQGGYCSSLKDAGPLVIDQDFEAPGPAGGSLRRINIEPHRDKLWGYVLRETRVGAEPSTEAGREEIRRLDFENGVIEALSWYVRDFQHQANIPEFHGRLRNLREAIERFKSELPDETTPLGHFLFKTFTGEILLLDRLRPSLALVNALTDEWRDRAGFDAVQGRLDVMLRYAGAAQTLMGKSKKRPPQHQIATFVRTLAKTWEGATGRWPKSGRHPDGGRQSGPFADFVREINDLLPPPFRVHTLDHAIRSVCKKSSRA